jgi:hypothetical protein
VKFSFADSPLFFPASASVAIFAAFLTNSVLTASSYCLGIGIAIIFKDGHKILFNYAPSSPRPL